MSTKTYRSYARCSTEAKLRSLSPEALVYEREKTYAMVLFWKFDQDRMVQYSNKLELIDAIIKERKR